MNKTLRRTLLFTLLSCSTWLSAWAQAPAAPAAPALGMVYDVRNGDQQGKLMIRETELAFESLTDGKHSRSWKYAEIRSIEKKRKEVRVRPYKGSRYDFQFPDNGMRDKIYDSISQRILTARAQGKK